MSFVYFHRLHSSERCWADIGPDARNALSERQFEAWLSSWKEYIVDWTVCAQRYVDKSQECAVGLTFDDGYSDFRSIALPYLESVGVRVLMFVTTQFASKQIKPYEYVVAEILRLRPNVDVRNKMLKRCVKTGDGNERYKALVSVMKIKSPEARARLVEQLLEDNNLADSELNLPEMLGWDELNELARHPLVDIGAHTISHPFLPALNLRAAWREIRGCKKLIEDRLNVRVDSFAYPYGANTKHVRYMVRAAGFRYGFATETGRGGRMAMPRTNATDWPARGC